MTHRLVQFAQSGMKKCTISRNTNLIAPGMGAGAYDSIRAAGICPIVTDLLMITDAVRAYLKGTLVDHVERLH